VTGGMPEQASGEAAAHGGEGDPQQVGEWGMPAVVDAMREALRSAQGGVGFTTD